MFSVKPDCSSKAGIAVRRSPATFSGSGKSRRYRLRVPELRVNGKGSVRAVISSGDKTLEAASPLESKGESNGSLGSLRGGGIEVRAVVTVRKKMKEKLAEKMADQWEFFVNGFGQGIIIQLISEEIDPVTNSGKSVESSVRGWLTRPLTNSHFLSHFNRCLSQPPRFPQPPAASIPNSDASAKLKQKH